MPKTRSAKTGRYTDDADKDTTIVESVKKKPDVKKAAEEFLKNEDAAVDEKALPDLLIRFGKYLLKQK